MGSDSKSLTIGELMRVIAIVGVGLGCLPRPLDLMSAIFFPAALLCWRIYPRLRLPLCQLIVLAAIPILFVPAFVTADPFDRDVAVIATIFSLPLVVKLLVEWDSLDRCPFLDSLVVFCAPITGLLHFSILVRMFELRILVWNL